MPANETTASTGSPFLAITLSSCRVEPFDTALDTAILEDRDAVAPWMVLADYLESHGHPRAELIRIGLQIGGKPDPFLEGCERAYLEQHRAVLADWPASIYVRWRRGFVTTAICHDAVDWPAHRSLRFVRHVDLVGTKLRFDSAPDGIESLRVDGGRLDSLTTLQLPRLTRLAVRLPSPWLRYETVDWVMQRFPTLAALRFESCDARFVTALVERLPAFVRGGLRSLAVDCLTDEHARSLVQDAGELGELVLSARGAMLAPESYVALHAALPGWRGTHADESVATDHPQCATVIPPPVPLGDELTVSGGCRGCQSSRTEVIWLQNHGYPLGINDLIELEYEVVCLDCERFSVHTEFQSLA